MSGVEFPPESVRWPCSSGQSACTATSTPLRWLPGMLNHSDHVLQLVRERSNHQRGLRLGMDRHPDVSIAAADAHERQPAAELVGHSLDRHRCRRRRRWTRSCRRAREARSIAPGHYEARWRRGCRCCECGGRRGATIRQWAGPESGPTAGSDGSNVCTGRACWPKTGRPAGPPLPRHRDQGQTHREAPAFTPSLAYVSRRGMRRAEQDET